MREFGSLYDAYDAVGYVPKLAPERSANRHAERKSGPGAFTVVCRHGQTFHRAACGTWIAAYVIRMRPTAASLFSLTKEAEIMSKATSALLAAVAALTLSGGAYAQAAGGSSGNGSTGSTASPANQVNSATGGYGTPGTTNSDSGMSGRPNSGLPSSVNSDSTSGATAPVGGNNTLATPSVKSPASGK
jgi:hypothetical protein